ncbi:MAG: SDR family NAD(P)-dependent oxidoreductase [Planctomycetota bacterium]
MMRHRDPADTARNELELLTLEARLLEQASVHDGAVRARREGSADRHIVIYIVPGDSPARSHLETIAAAALPFGATFSIVFLTSIPRTDDGRVDEGALAAIPVTDEALERRWQQALESVPGVERAGVVLEVDEGRATRLHLADLLPADVLEPARLDGSPPGERPSGERSAERTLALAPSISVGAPWREDRARPVTLAGTIERAAREEALDRNGQGGIVHVLAEGSSPVQSYADLLAEARCLQGGLQRLGLRAGEPVLFQLPSSKDFLPAFWGCVLGGLVPVPVTNPPHYEPANAIVQKLLNAWTLLEEPLILAAEAHVAAIRELGTMQGRGFRVHSVEELRRGVEELRRGAPATTRHEAAPDDPALMMLTSGSTGVPKAVVLTHANLLARAAGSVQMNGFTRSEVSFNWMALDHVAGLIYFHLRDVFLGCRQVHAASELILQDPLRWLDIIQQHRVTVTFAPNFAFRLVNEQVEMAPERRWDLSSLRFVLNGGEAIVAPTARRFLELLIPHGLHARAMVPAWGMSETSSGVVYSERFSLDTVSDSDSHVEVGRPIPGFAMRIVDAAGDILPEGTIGRLQVRGETVTRGYHRAPEINAQSFTPDGWFMTGDLGMLRDGRLTITGREKDEIIINGVNYVGPEIEAVVESVEGVKSSFTAACAVRPRGSDTDALVIFFSPAVTGEEELRELIEEIRSKVATQVGIRPAWIVPVEAAEIPKTNIGKIQRRQLKERFSAGEFDAVVKQVDRLCENASTLPAWFYRKIWRRDEPGEGMLWGRRVLVILDRLGLGDALRAELERRGCPAIAVEPGPDFARVARDRFRIDPHDSDHYNRLAEELAAESRGIEDIVHLATVGEPPARLSPADLERAQRGLVASCLALVQGLGRHHAAVRAVRLFFVTSGAQSIGTGDAIAPERSIVSPLLKTAARELAWLEARHVDLPPVPLSAGELSRGDATLLAPLLVRELAIARPAIGRSGDEVAYRDGKRWVWRLAKVQFAHGEGSGLPFRRGDFFVVSGGLGGIGTEVSRHLCTRLGLRLLLLGRSPRARYEHTLLFALQQAGGDVLYEVADVGDARQVQAAVERAEQYWGRKLDGVIHLAGTFRERALLAETTASMLDAMRAKTAGAVVFHDLLAARGGGLFVSFGSVNGLLGGVGVGAYAAANRFLSSFAQWQNSCSSVRACCFEWSMWGELGMSRDTAGKELSRAQGYHALRAQEGLHSLLAGLVHGERHLVIGLDDAKPNVRRFVEAPASPLHVLTGYVTSRTGALSEGELARLCVPDRFGVASRCRVRRLDVMPLRSDGTIDREALANVNGRGKRAGTEQERPLTALEQRIAAIWQEILGVPEVRHDDNFFALGGDSIKGALVINRMQEATGEIFHVVALFNAPTVTEFGALLTENYPDAAARLIPQEVLSASGLPQREQPTPAQRVDLSMLDSFAAMIPRLQPRRTVAPLKNARAIFVLAPPRSGTTLLRVVLGGHPRLFAPPELFLLGFNTLGERKRTFSGPLVFWREGLARALMELIPCTAAEAQARVDELESRDLSSAETYGYLQQLLKNRILVDKTPTYALDLEALRRAEEDFVEPLYIHLQRHPYGMIRSFEEGHFEQVIQAHIPELGNLSVAARGHPFTSRQIAEMVWLVCQENILRFLAQIPAHRRHAVRFEDLVREPRTEVGGLCRFLGIELDEKMLRPHEDKKKRMTDGLHEVSRMLGDLKFHEHKTIDAAVADRWQEEYRQDFLCERTWQVASSFGYRPRGEVEERGEVLRVERHAADLLKSVGTLPQSEVDRLLKEMTRP